MSELFYEDVNIFSDIKIVKMMSDYGFCGLGYYFAIIAELFKKGSKYGLEDLGILAKNTGIEKKKLRNFINDCINKYTDNDTGIFQSDNEYFWCDRIGAKKKTKSKTTGKAGRPKKDIITDRMEFKDIKELEDVEFVNLGISDYQKLISKYDEELVLKGIRILENWLALSGSTAKQYIGRNHYHFFKKDGWVLTRAAEELKKRTKNLWGNC